MDELLPCPFCGSNKIQCELEEDGPQEWYRVMECDECGAKGPMVADTQDDPCGDALMRWNRRAPSQFGRPVIENDAQEALNKAMEELPIILSWSETPAPDDHSYSEDEEGY